MLKLFKVCYNRNEFTDSKKEYPILVAIKKVWAENERMAILLGECIAFNDGEKLNLPIRYDFIDVLEC